MRLPVTVSAVIALPAVLSLRLGGSLPAVRTRSAFSQAASLCSPPPMACPAPSTPPPADQAPAARGDRWGKAAVVADSSGDWLLAGRKVDVGERVVLASAMRGGGDKLEDRSGSAGRL